MLFLPLDGPAIVRVNLFVRSIATISDIKMVSIWFMPVSRRGSRFSLRVLYITVNSRRKVGYSVWKAVIKPAYFPITSILNSQTNNLNLLAFSIDAGMRHISACFLYNRVNVIKDSVKIMQVHHMLSNFSSLLFQRLSNHYFFNWKIF